MLLVVIASYVRGVMIYLMGSAQQDTVNFRKFIEFI